MRSGAIKSLLQYYTHARTHTHTHIHRFNGHFPGEPGLVGCLLDSPSKQHILLYYNVPSVSVGTDGMARETWFVSFLSQRKATGCEVKLTRAFLQNSVLRTAAAAAADGSYVCHIRSRSGLCNQVRQKLYRTRVQISWQIDFDEQPVKSLQFITYEVYHSQLNAWRYLQFLRFIF